MLVLSCESAKLKNVVNPALIERRDHQTQPKTLAKVLIFFRTSQNYIHSVARHQRGHHTQNVTARVLPAHRRRRRLHLELYVVSDIMLTECDCNSFNH